MTVARVIPIRSARRNVLRKNPIVSTVTFHGFEVETVRDLMRGPDSGENLPFNTSPILMCDQNCEKPTKHIYLGKTAVKTKKHASFLFDEFQYQCSECGGERPWGIEDPLSELEDPDSKFEKNFHP